MIPVSPLYFLGKKVLSPSIFVCGEKQLFAKKVEGESTFLKIKWRGKCIRIMKLRSWNAIWVDRLNTEGFKHLRGLQLEPWI